MKEFLAVFVILLYFFGSICNEVKPGRANVSLNIMPMGHLIGRVGQDVTFMCLVSSTPMVHQVFIMEWSLPGVEEKEKGRITHKRRKLNDILLQISGLKLSDSGEYECRATHKDYEPLSAKVTLSVLPELGTCGTGFFRCLHHENECVPHRFVCDGRADCTDGSDEALEQCGPLPCEDKIRCDDGRCLAKHMCCHHMLPHSVDCNVTHLPPCCFKHLQTIYNRNPAYVEQQKRYENDLGFLTSTIYTIIGCAVTFIFIVSIMVVAVCRVHMKQNVMSPLPRGMAIPPPGARHAFLWTGVGDGDLYSSPSVIEANGFPSAANLLVTYNINNGIQFMGRVIDPPPYSEVADANDDVVEGSSQNGPFEGPPPPYCSDDDLRIAVGQCLPDDESLYSNEVGVLSTVHGGGATTTSPLNLNLAEEGGSAVGRDTLEATMPNRALLRPNIIVNRMDGI